jgi:hypothetical protein
MTQFLRDQASDSEEVDTPLMLDGTYLSRNFATLGPLPDSRRVISYYCNGKGKWDIMSEFSFPQLIVVPLSCHEVDGVRKEKETETTSSTASGHNLS